MSPEAIVESVLWPKRQVKEGYLLTQVATKDGRALQGYRVAESADQLTLRNFTDGRTRGHRQDEPRRPARTSVRSCRRA